MEFRHLRCFIAVAEELHFARAAERLPIEQSPLSRTIKELEEDLEEQLFIRTSRSTRLTRAGKLFLEHVAVPHYLHTALSVADLAVVLAQDARALRDQQKLAGRRVIDRLRHRGDDIAWQVGLDARKLTFACPANLKSDLDRYAALHAQAYGEAVDATTLIPHMLEAFMGGDRWFKREQNKKSAIEP